MHKCLLFSDLHITAPGETIIGLDPSARFSAALDQALRHHPDARQLLILGDLTHTGHPQEYARLRDLLTDCPVPVTATLGNHDDRAAYFSAFPGAARDANGFAQAALDIGPCRVLLLDTLDESGVHTRHAGYLCDARLDWLRARLAKAPDRPTLIAMHHPPVRTGFDGMDRIRLCNDAAFLALLRAHPQVRQLVCGHVHRAISGNHAGLAWSILKSPCHQMPMLLGADGSGHSVDEPGGYAIALLDAETMILHAEDVTPARPVGQSSHS
ncbi:phosphodiesterase [Thalassococcus sp. BH17M4-6]|uniref:phosphodiesterase n=1 Tax=Thalassococcus sp. BH17M4-6 TaxID=3413148 RepID=UPI003BDBD64B